MGEKRGTITRRDFVRLTALGAFGGIGGAALGDWTADDLRVVKHDLQLPNWDAPGFRIAVLSDLHANSSQESERARRACAMAVSLAPDAILLPGDFLNDPRAGGQPHLAHALEPLGDAGCPVLGTLGNHDYSTRHQNDIVRTAGRVGLTILRNRAVDVQGVTVAGLDDALFRRANPAFLSELDHSRSLISMLHEPDFVGLQPDHVSLQVSGHSHGGQICLPGGRPLHLPYGGRDHFAGYYPSAKVPLFVTVGVGTTGPGWRLFCPPEVVQLTLTGPR